MFNYLNTLLRLLYPCRITGVEFTIFALIEVSSEFRVVDSEKFLMGESESDKSINDGIVESSRWGFGAVLGNIIAYKIIIGPKSRKIKFFNWQIFRQIKFFVLREHVICKFVKKL